MTTIYIVTSGAYSDYSINAVFDSRDQAEAYIAYEEQRGYRSGHDIEEWTLNEYADPISKGLTCFQVVFDDITKGDAEAKASSASDEYENARKHGKIRMYWTCLWAQDEQAALKIANERRVRYLLRQEREETQHP